MVKTKFKKAVSLMLAVVMSLTAFMGIGATTAFAAVGEKADVYLVDYPRSGDTNNNGEWGHGNLNYMNGWKGLSTKYTGLRAMGSYSGNIAYCIEPGTGQRTGDTLTEKDENFFNNISPNGTISGDDIRLLIGRILQYGYRGGISTSWKSQNESDANCIAHAYATQILIWETIVGERDASFNHVSTVKHGWILLLFVPLYITKRSEAVLQWGKRKNIKKLIINGELVIEWKKEKSIKDVVVENICYD